MAKKKQSKMAIKTVKVSEKGQIAIPQSVRESMNIEQGDELILFQMGDKILLEKPQKIEQKIKDDFKDMLKFSEISLRSVWNNKEDDIWSEYLKK